MTWLQCLSLKSARPEMSSYSCPLCQAFVVVVFRTLQNESPPQWNNPPAATAFQQKSSQSIYSMSKKNYIPLLKHKLLAGCVRVPFFWRNFECSCLPFDLINYFGQTCFKKDYNVYIVHWDANISISVCWIIPPCNDMRNMLETFLCVQFSYVIC